MPLAYFDGQFVEKETIRISPLDFGFNRGVTAFDFTRVYGKVAFRLQDHIQRFIGTAQFLGIELKQTPEDITTAVNKIVAANNYPHSGIKFYLTLGECGKPGGVGFKLNTGFTPHFMMIQEELHPQSPQTPLGVEVYRKGIALKTVPFHRQLSEVKTINYAPGFLAAQQLADSDYDEIIYTTPADHLTETTTGNVFFVIDGALCTPRNEMLNGITRTVVLELAAKTGVPTRVMDLTLNDLRRASGGFTTGSFQEMLPLRKIDDVTFGATTDEPVYAKLRKAFIEYIRDYCQQ